VPGGSPGGGVASRMRGLSAEERTRLVDAAIRDEVYYREALALGLDVEHDQV